MSHSVLTPSTAAGATPAQAITMNSDNYLDFYEAIRSEMISTMLCSGTAVYNGGPTVELAIKQAGSYDAASHVATDAVNIVMRAESLADETMKALLQDAASQVRLQDAALRDAVSSHVADHHNINAVLTAVRDALDFAESIGSMTAIVAAQLNGGAAAISVAAPYVSRGRRGRRGRD